MKMRKRQTRAKYYKLADCNRGPEETTKSKHVLYLTFPGMAKLL